MVEQKTAAGKRVSRQSRLGWVPIAKMKVNPTAQREFSDTHAETMAADFNLESVGFPVVNLRGGVYYVVDRQHRVAAFRKIGWEDQQIQCEVYEDLTEAEEAELYLERNQTRHATAYDKFRVGITAGRHEECDIDRIVRSQGLCISRDTVSGGIRAVGKLRKVYSRGDATLARTLILIRDAYGDAGFDGNVIDGIGLLCQRYNGDLDPDAAAIKLGKARGGVSGLIQRAEILRKQTGNTKSHCVAAAAVDIINGGRGGKKLPSWWKS